MTSDQLTNLVDLLTSRRFHIPAAHLASVLALECLIAIWAAEGRGNWFIRGAGMWAAVAVWVPIDAYEALWLFGGTSLMIVACLRSSRLFARFRSNRVAPYENDAPQRFARRFTLKQLFLLTLLAAMWLAILMPAMRSYLPEKPLGWLTASLMLALLSVLAWCCAVGRRRPIAAALLAIMIPIGSAAILKCGNWMWRLPQFGVEGEGHFWHDLALVTIVGAEFSLMLVLPIALARAAFAISQPIGRRLLSGGTLGAAFCVFAAPFGYNYWLMIAPPPRDPPLETQTNHYRRIVAIAQKTRALNPRMRSVEELRIAAPNTTTARDVAAFYEELFQLLEGANAVDWDLERDDMAEQQQDQMQVGRNVCRLALAIVAEGRSARKDRRLDRAAICALACLRLGAMFQRGGDERDAEIGAQVENYGNVELMRMRAELSPELSRRAIAESQRAIEEREAPNAIISRGDYISKRAWGWQHVWEVTLHHWTNPPHLIHSHSEQLEILDNRRRALAAASILLRTDLAIRLFQNDRGRWPKQLAELTPDYLPAALLDPYSGRPLMYRATRNGFMLYSVGSDGKDNGGAFEDRPADYQSLTAQAAGLDMALPPLVPRD